VSRQEAQSAGEDKARCLSFNKVCELEDFADPGLVEIMRDVFRHEIEHFTPDFPKGAEYRKYWEIAMSVRAMRHFGALRPDAVVLGVGAGTEATLFYLTNHVRQVFATDLYLNHGIWGAYAPRFMLIDPWRFAPYEFDEKRLVVQHMDGRYLKYPDNTFDGIFSSSSVEHFGEFDDIANSAYEMGRVLKIGGVLTLSTEYCIAEPSSGTVWDLDHVRLFSLAELKKHIVDASGLEMVDEIDTSISPQTMASKHELRLFGKDLYEQTKKQGLCPRAGEVIWSKYPHLVLTHHGYVFGSVHLTLRKTENYPNVVNDWATPQWSRFHASALRSQVRVMTHLASNLSRVSLFIIRVRNVGRAWRRH
jgi:SAM-dependent methyltransferase